MLVSITVLIASPLGTSAPVSSIPIINPRGAIPIHFLEAIRILHGLLKVVILIEIHQIFLLRRNKIRMKRTHCNSPTGNRKPKNKNKELAITQNKQKHKKKRPSKADELLPAATPLGFRKHGRRFEK
jgi:hypothetical protein